MKKEKIDPNIISISSVGICAALLIICSWISVPALGPFVPFTLQTFAIFLIAGLFSLKTGLLSVAVFIALGAVGLPVFSGFKSGIAAILGPTGGYMVGFIFAVLLISMFKHIKPNSVLFMVFGMITGLIVCYAFGTAWFYFVYAKTGEGMGILKILSLCVFPFLIPDAVKMVLAVILVNRLSIPLSRLGFTDSSVLVTSDK